MSEASDLFVAMHTRAESPPESVVVSTAEL